MDLEKDLGYFVDHHTNQKKLIQYLNLKLKAIGQPAVPWAGDAELLTITEPLLESYWYQSLLLNGKLCPADQRIQNFLDRYFADVPGPSVRLPSNTLILDRHGLAKALSLPIDSDEFSGPGIHSYRVQQGVLHNPASDRRTTQGVFHVAEGGLPIPDDKIAVPKAVCKALFLEALKPPPEFLALPFTSTQKEQAHAFVSLLLRPTVCPSVPGFLEQKSLEVRFFAPGGLVCNLDFVESIFGNAGDPCLPENNAGLDFSGWTGHSGMVLLAPHLVRLRKKDLGLPHVSQATERQKRDGMCWEKEGEFYNDGRAFKITARTQEGVIVTVIADNYFGYCKKEVKTQISFSANLYGLSEEEHAGGALAFANYDLGEDFQYEEKLPSQQYSFKNVIELWGENIELQPEGYAIDRHYPDIYYVPEDAAFNMQQQTVSWNHNGEKRQIKLLATTTYVFPNGYKVRLKKQTGGSAWHLFATVAEGTLCHKPSTVSGGGKSEISKSIVDAMIQGPIFVADFQKDLDEVEEILHRPFGDQFKQAADPALAIRPILSQNRSLGSVIKLLTPSEEYTDRYNAWLQTISPRIKQLVFVVKRYYRSEWGENWREHFSVDAVNGHPGYELKYGRRKLIANYLRVGVDADGSWRIFRVRQDFSAAEKLQVEDDISASIVVPAAQLQHLNPAYKNPSVKLVTNCEFRLFQRPDDAIYPGRDRQAEQDLVTPGSFLSNYEPLARKDAQSLVEDAIGFDEFTLPVKNLVQEFLENPKSRYFVSSAHPRLVGGKPSKNPRYLQNRPDVLNPKQKYLAQVGTRLARRIPSELPVLFPVNAVLPGRRNNPPDLKLGIPPLAVYNPIHYQELPELFMDFVCSLTGKSPSTTGFGSEGALTKGPFNALLPVHDLNQAVVSYILTGYSGFTTAAGFVGPNLRVDHDVSLLVPEIWCRMTPAERDPQYLIANGYLEKLDDYVFGGQKILASRLGYRITQKFVLAFLGRIFNDPARVFSPEMLRPETQDAALYAQGIEAIVITQQRVAEHYFADKSVDLACPPLRAILHIMARGTFEGKDEKHPDVRALFSRAALLKSDWYRARLKTQQESEIARTQKFIEVLRAESQSPVSPAAQKTILQQRLGAAELHLKLVSSPQYLQKLEGTLGAELR